MTKITGYYTVLEASEYLDVHILTIRDYTRKKELPSIKIGCNILIPAGAIETYLERRKEQGRPVHIPEAILQDDVVLIPISGRKGKGKHAIADTEDADLASIRWHLTTGYATHSGKQDGKRTNIRMHRVVAERILERALLRNEFIDHIDGDKLNNRRRNIRLATTSQNQMNRRKSTMINGKATSSRYKGVSYTNRSGRRKRWEAYIGVNGQKISLGMHRTQYEGALAYDRAAKRYFGKFAKLNFPSKGNTSVTSPP